MRLLLKKITYPIILLVAALLIYAPGLGQMGLYWDDLPNTFFAADRGAMQVVRTVATARPALSVLFYLPYQLLGAHPLPCHFLGIFSRWLMVLAMVLLLQDLFPDRTQENRLAGLLFLVYPGFHQQWISKIYPPIFFVFTLECFSLILFNRSLRADGHRSNILTFLSLALSFYCLNASEYVFALEWLRPLLIYQFFKQQNGDLPLKNMVIGILRRWSPFVIMLLLFIVTRSFFTDSSLYDVVRLSDLAQAPFQSLRDWAIFSIRAAWNAVVSVWSFLLSPFFWQGLTSRPISFAPLFFCVLYFALFPHSSAGGQSSSQNKHFDSVLLWLGMISVLFAGTPFWAAGLTPRLDFPNDRFFLSYMFGASILLLRAINLLNPRPVLKNLVFIFFFCAGSILQYSLAETYRQDWERAQDFLTQFSWRAPSFDATTLFLAEELPLAYYSDNSLTGALNWLYATKTEVPELPAMLNYTTVRLGRSLPSLSAGAPVEQSFLLYDFHGSMDRMIVIFHHPPGCLHFAVPEYGQLHPLLPVVLSQTASWSNIDLINSEKEQNPLFFIPEKNENDWCYYFQKASLASQFGDDQVVVELGKMAFAKGLFPQDPSEAIPFILAYSRTGEWNRALQLTFYQSTVFPEYQPMLCEVWNIIGEETQDCAEKNLALAEVEDSLSCHFRRE